MIRITVRVNDGSDRAHLNLEGQSFWKSFDIEAPEVEKYIAEANGSYSSASVVGVEILPEPEAKT
jgi:hypothetical protein